LKKVIPLLLTPVWYRNGIKAEMGLGSLCVAMWFFPCVPKKAGDETMFSFCRAYIYQEERKHKR